MELLVKEKKVNKIQQIMKIRDEHFLNF